jgi:hypothetical protein
MKISGLSALYKQMKQDSETRCKVEFGYRAVIFDVLFLIDESPFSLMFGAKGHNIAFAFEVGPGFTVDPRIPHEEYVALCRALGLVYDPVNRFSIKGFLEDFSEQVPHLVTKKSAVKPHEVARHRRDVEESERIYFFGWRDNNKRGEQGSEGNLHKTRRLLGESMYLHCKKHNISSCWTDIAEQVVELTAP